MNDGERAAAAATYGVRPESVLQLEAARIGDEAVLALLGLRNEVQRTFFLARGFERLRPHVADVLNTYLLFGGGEAGLARVRIANQLYLTDITKRTEAQASMPRTYRQAQDMVTHGYQRALYDMVTTSPVVSRLLGEAEDALTVDTALLYAPVKQRALGAAGVVGAEVFLEQEIEGADRLGAEARITQFIEAALKLPDEDVRLRNPKDELIRLSKPDILLAFAHFRAHDADFLNEVRTAISRGTEPFKSAVRRFALYRVTRNPDDLVDAGLAAFHQAHEILAKPLTPQEKRSGTTEYNIAKLFDTLHAVVAEQQELSPAEDRRPVDAQGPEATMMRRLITSATQLDGYKSGRKDWVISAHAALAVLTGADVDVNAYKRLDPAGYLDNIVATGMRTVAQAREERLQRLQDALEGKPVGADRVDLVIDLIALIAKFNDSDTKRTVFELDLSFLAPDRASRVRNAFCDAVLARGDTEGIDAEDMRMVAAVVDRITNRAKQREYRKRMAAMVSTETPDETSAD